MVPAPAGDDLSEIAQIYEDRRGRPELAKAIREMLRPLQPTAGLLTLPDFNWLSIYTTNFDTLVEEAYRARRQDLPVCRSNFEMNVRQGNGTVLYKIHGCVSQDTADGHRSRMLITDTDYDDFTTYRQALFNSLRTDMYASNTVIVGQSLADRHLKDLVKEVAALRAEGIQGRVFLLVHEYDEARASLYTRRGVDVIGADLDDLLRALVAKGKASEEVAYSTSSHPDSFLSSDLILSTTDVAHAAALQPNPQTLFNGSPATYADIKAGVTIPRSAQARLESAQTGTRGYFLVISGARGVGKTSLARALLFSRAEQGITCWEHLSDQPLNVESWLAVEIRLKQANREAILFVDDCTRNLRSVNKLVEALAALDRPRLRLVVTAETAKWRVANKASAFFSRGHDHRLSVLDRGDIEALVSLVASRPAIRQLVEQQFLAMGRSDQIRRLQTKCSADMFVCLKNIFANDHLDQILLEEYYELTPEAQDVYRYVSAIQAMGGIVHRQLIMRVQGIGAGGLDTLLGQLDGIVHENLINERQGIYAWRTRHDVIAGVIAKWKFADQDELFSLFETLIHGLNPIIPIEMETANALATEDDGIRRITSFERQVALFQDLIETVPAQRTPRRRLVKLYLSEGKLSEAEQEIDRAEKALGNDQVLPRYRAILQLKKADTLVRLEDGDRRAILQDAEGIMRRCIARYGPNVYSYRTLGDIGLALARRFGDFTAIDDAIEQLQSYELIHADPIVPKTRRSLQNQLRSIEAGQPQEAIELEDGDPGLIEA